MIDLLIASVLVTRLLSADGSPKDAQNVAYVARNVGDTTPAPPAVTTSTFATDLKAIAKQAGLAVLVEGVPGKKRTADAPIKDGIADASDSVPDDLQRIAAAYDYTARRVGSHVVIFEKKFTDPAELPDIPRAEALADLHALNSEINGLISPEPYDRVLYDLYQAMPTEGRAAAKNGVAYSSLSPDAQIRVRQFAISSYLEIVPRLLSYVDRRLKALGGNGCSLSRGEYWHEKLAVVRGPFGPDGEDWDVILGGWIMTQAGGAYGFDGQKSAVLVNDHIVSKVPDPTEPNSGTPGAAEPTITDNATISLGQAMDSLSGQLATPRFSAAPAVSSKRVILIQPNSASPIEIAGAAAKLFGLRLREQEEHSYLLACPETRDIHGVDELGTECQRLLPTAYQRYITANGWLPLYYASIKRVRTLVEPRLSADGHAVPLADAGPEATDRIALAGLASCQESIDTMERPFPAYMSHLESAWFTVKQDPTDPNHMLQYSFDYDEPHAPGARHSMSAKAGAVSPPQ